MKVFVELTELAARADRAELRDTVARLVDVGATGVSVSDHLFATQHGRSRAEHAEPGCDPLTTLAAVAGLTDRLELQTVVMNTAWLHPALLLRGFNQLALLVGGERVTAGLGAGWSSEEFEALGLTMPRFRPRMDRLAEVLALARAFTDGKPVTFDGEHVVARDLPPSPRSPHPPRLLVGGGSDRVLELAGRYVDVLDLHGDPRHGRVAGTTMAEAAAGDVRRRALTTVADLASRIELVRAAGERAGRPRDAVGVCTQIWFTAYGSAEDVRAAETALAADWAGLPGQPLGRSPYLLFGSPAQMAEALLERAEAYGLSRISLKEGGAARYAPDPVRFCREVLPLLG